MGRAARVGRGAKKPSNKQFTVSEGRIDLAEWIAFLRTQTFNEILVEAGPTLSGALIREGWVDRLVLYQAPKLLGDSARPLATMALDRLGDAVELAFTEVTRMGSDLRIIAAPLRRHHLGRLELLPHKHLNPFIGPWMGCLLFSNRIP